MTEEVKRASNAFFVEEHNESTLEEPILQVSCRLLLPNPHQPRKFFDEAALRELATSIEQHGILQPIIVRKKHRRYEIVAGERRFRAAQIAGLTEVPVLVRQFDEREMMELALLENLQRENLTPIEEAEAYAALMKHIGFTQEELAARVGKSRPHIANHLRLLNLPTTVRNYVDSEQLTMGHGRALASIKSDRKATALAELAIAKQLNVRQLERLVQQEAPKKRSVSVELRNIEAELREHLGTGVRITNVKQKGKIEIDFYSEEELIHLIALLKGE